MKQKKLSFIFLIGTFSLIFLATCNNHPSDTNIPSLKVDLSKAGDILMSTIFSDINYIPLETKPNTLIGERSLRIKVFKDKIYVKEQKRVTRFNLDGSFEKEIIHIGRGPDEIMGITDLAFGDDNIYILGITELAKLDAEGKLIDKINVPNTSESIYCYPDGQILIYHGLTLSETSSFKAGLYDKNLKLIKNFFSVPPSSSRPVMLNCIHPGDKGVYLSQMFNDTIFDMTSKTPRPYLILDFGAQKRTYDNSLFISRFPSIMDIIISSKFWLFHLYHFPEEGKLVEYKMIYFPKETKYILTKDKITNDLDNGLDFSPFLIYSTDNENLLYMVLRPIDIIKRLESLNKDDTKPLTGNRFIEMAKKISELDNPVLMQCKIK